MEDVGSGSKKRKRNPNWDDAEKTLLRACLKDNLDTIENKCVDTNINNIKKVAWQKVCQSFNELNTKQRTLAEIKQQWRTLKIDAKKSYSSFKKTLNQTGGGEPPPSLGQNTIDILETLPLEFKEGVNKFDCDNITHVKFNNNKKKATDGIISLENMQDKDFIVDQTPEQIPPANKFARRVLIKSNLKTSGRKRQKINEEMKVTLNNRKERDTALITILFEEHELKMEHMDKADARAQEEHILRIKQLKLQNVLLEKQLLKYDE